MTLGRTTVDIAGRAVPLTLRRSPRARRISLRADPVLGEVRLTLPRRASLAAAHALVDANRDWVAAQVAGWPEPRPFAPGATIPWNGGELRLEWRPGSAPRSGRIEPGRLLVGGPVEAFAARVRRIVQHEARRLLQSETDALAARLDRRVPVAIGDPRGRWGSCSPSGALRYSWRLVFAPAWVRLGVVAHEVAHLVHFNHGPGFYALCHELAPVDQGEVRRWLAANGAALHWVGRDP